MSGKKSKSSKNVKAESTGNLLMFKPEDLSSDKIVLVPNKPKDGQTQLVCFPKYLDGDVKNAKNIVVVTEPITLTKGGIPRLGTFITKNSQRQFMYIGEDTSQPANVALFKALRAIDEKYDNEINKHKNENGVVTKLNKNGEPTKVKKLV